MVYTHKAKLSYKMKHGCFNTVPLFGLFPETRITRVLMKYYQGLCLSPVYTCNFQLFQVELITAIKYINVKGV
jgi:hypothetical protein